MLLGAGSMVLALLEPQRSGVQTGFIASSIGISAIVIGSRLVKDRYRFGSVARAFGRGGAILGSVGTALMAYAVLAVALSVVGVSLPALSLPIESRGTVIGGNVSVDVSAPGSTASAGRATMAPAEAASPAPVLAPAPAPAPATAAGPTSFEAERSAVVQSAGTVAYVLRKDFGTGPFPETLHAVQGTPARIALPDGTGLAPLPDGARILYSTSEDRSSWSITVIGSRFGATATYSSAIGTVQGG